MKIPLAPTRARRRPWRSATGLLGLAAALTLSDQAAATSIAVSINTAPPPLPVYEQPIAPAADYLWTPGYWAYADGGQGDGPYDGYYWVPGAWVLAPQPGYLWTPPYWACERDVYVFHRGYWGPRVGFYGGVNYGYGYTGSGYYGGRWEGQHFAYNTAVNHVNPTQVHNTYNTVVVNKTVVNNVSYNGGAGGIHARPTAAERAAEHDHHQQFTAAQRQQQNLARRDPQQHSSGEHGAAAKWVAADDPDRPSPRSGDEPGPGADQRHDPGHDQHHDQGHGRKGPNDHEADDGRGHPGSPEAGGNARRRFPRQPTVNEDPRPMPRPESSLRSPAPHAPAGQPQPHPPAAARTATAPAHRLPPNPERPPHPQG